MQKLVALDDWDAMTEVMPRKAMNRFCRAIMLYLRKPVINLNDSDTYV